MGHLGKRKSTIQEIDATKILAFFSLKSLKGIFAESLIFSFGKKDEQQFPRIFSFEGLLFKSLTVLFFVIFIPFIFLKYLVRPLW